MLRGTEPWAAVWEVPLGAQISHSPPCILGISTWRIGMAAVSRMGQGKLVRTDCLDSSGVLGEGG